MKKLFILITILLCTLCVFSYSSNPLYAMGKKLVSNQQTSCPHCDKPIDQRYYIDYQNKRMYCCGPKCHSEISSNPKKYVEILQDGGVSLEDIGK